MAREATLLNVLSTRSVSSASQPSALGFRALSSGVPPGRTASSRGNPSVERRGRACASLLFLLHVCFLTVVLGAGASSVRGQTAMLDNFESDRGWRAVNDNVMGGRSLGEVIVRDGRLQFEGSINTQGGGFASIRRTIEVGKLLGAKAVSLRLRGDGRQYRLTLRDNKQVRGRSVSYQAGFSTSPKGQWQNVRIELKGLQASLFGQPIAVGEVDLGSVWSIGIIIADAQDGPFTLHLDRLEFLRE